MTVQGANRRDMGLLAELIGVSLGAVLASLSAVRRGKVVHPDGVVHDARLIVPGEAAAPRAARLLSQPGEHRAVVRFSRSLGLPRPLPDLLGLSVRVLDPYGPGCHQDFLLVSSADLPILHHLFLPARDVQQRPFTSSLPYRAGGETFLVGALPDHGSPLPSGGDEFDRIEAAAATKQLRFHLAVASAWGRFRPVAELGVGRRLPAELDALRFNPWNTGGGLEPAGALNRARDRAYRMSQASWRRTRRDGAQLQDAADRRLAALSSASHPQ
ncbi:MAG: hypothetical protein ACM3UV_06495 [Nocardioidaceae bacterium]